MHTVHMNGSTIDLTPARNAQPAQFVLARHRATATTSLLKALHYHRFFGHPIDGFTAEHNLARAESNDRTVRAYAKQAGQYAFYAGETLDRWISDYTEAMCVPRIRDAMGDGWHETVVTLHSNPGGLKVDLVIDMVRS